MRPNTTRACRVLRRVGFRCVHAATSLVLASPSASSARRARRCTGPRLSDGLAGLARRLGWPCHFMTAGGPSEGGHEGVHTLNIGHLRRILDIFEDSWPPSKMSKFLRVAIFEAPFGHLRQLPNPATA